MVEMKSSLEIAQAAHPKPIEKIAQKLGLIKTELEHFGPFKAKVSAEALKRVEKKKDGKLVLVTAITPTPHGEGKTTITIGLGQGLAKLKKKAMICLRQPSMGPIFGVKGGATGGGYSQVLPMEEINLHFTGDIHAVTSANNLLASMVDNYIFYHKERFGSNPKITWKRAVDMNDRSLRDIQICMFGNLCIPRTDAFQITAASEVMAALCLSEDIFDLKNRLGKMVVGFDSKNKPIFARNLKTHGAMAAILSKAILPNLVQTIEGTPVFIHGGPFANIAHGCNSVIATKTALKLADIVVTEAGFASDLGAEKFFDIKCRSAGLKPDAVVIAATIRALRRSGGAKDYSKTNLQAVEKGLSNLWQHCENIQKFGVPFVIALNHFASDSKKEVELLRKKCLEKNFEFEISNAFLKGGKGSIGLAKKIVKLCNEKSNFKLLYSEKISVKEKIEKIAREIYRADGAEFSQKSLEDIALLEKNGLDKLPVCISKTQLSFSDDDKLIGAPRGFKIHIREIYPSNGAGFLVALSGKLITLPGLPKTPNTWNIDIGKDGKIKGLF